MRLFSSSQQVNFNQTSLEYLWKAKCAVCKHRGLQREPKSKRDVLLARVKKCPMGEAANQNSSDFECQLLMHELQTNRYLQKLFRQ